MSEKKEGPNLGFYDLNDDFFRFLIHSNVTSYVLYH